MRGRRAPVGWLLAVFLVGTGCVPDRPERTREAVPGEAVTRAGRVPEVEPIEIRIFNVETADFARGRVTLHILVPGDAGDEQIRQMFIRTLQERAEEDSTLVAIRAIAYKAVPRGRNEAALVPVGWGEWLPPGGWVDLSADARKRIHRIYTYFGGPPEW